MRDLTALQDVLDRARIDPSAHALRPCEVSCVRRTCRTLQAAEDDVVTRLRRLPPDVRVAQRLVGQP